ncbi:MAG: SHOCT domain-containing protein [Bacteroidales bacterium]|nr:SHOCT domain-containing protein [Bacteroidales bacterium]
MFYENYYWGMNLVWWIIWILLLFWIFAIPVAIPGQRKRSDSPIHILQKRYAAGEITTDDYMEKKKILSHDKA